MDISSSAKMPSTAYVSFERAVLHDNIALCDQKSGVLLALSAVLVIFCLQSLPLPEQIRVELGPGWAAAVVVLFAVGIIGFTIVAYLSLHVIRPRFFGSRGGHINWNSAAFESEPESFLERLAQQSESDLEREMTMHLHALGKVCRTKFAWLSGALLVGQVAFLSIVLAEVIRMVV